MTAPQGERAGFRGVRTLHTLTFTIALLSGCEYFSEDPWGDQCDPSNPSYPHLTKQALANCEECGELNCEECGEPECAGETGEVEGESTTPPQWGPWLCHQWRHRNHAMCVSTWADTSDAIAAAWEGVGGSVELRMGCNAVGSVVQEFSGGVDEQMTVCADLAQPLGSTSLRLTHQGGGYTLPDSVSVLLGLEPTSLPQLACTLDERVVCVGPDSGAQPLGTDCYCTCAGDEECFTIGAAPETVCAIGGDNDGLCGDWSN